MPALTNYLSLERAMLSVDDEGLADRLRDEMDPIWHSLSDDERQWLNDRNLGLHPEEHFREGADNWAEWSIHMDTDEEGKHHRLFVRLDDLIEVFESVVTSKNPGAREVGHAPRITLTSTEAEWLLRALPLALERKERAPKKEGEENEQEEQKIEQE